MNILHKVLLVHTVFIFALLAVFCRADSTDSALDTIKFSHKLHLKDVGAACLDCHTAAPENTGGGKMNHPHMESCKNCHKDEFDKKNCALCHSNVKKARFFQVELHHKSFSHKAHLVRGVECTFCHKNLDNVSYATKENLPDMSVCYSCHNDKKAPRNCTICHDDPQRIKPESHRSLWFLKEEHGRDARFNTLECEKCHQQTYCDQCHFGQSKFKIHDPNFSFTHGLEAQRRDKDCMMCHEVQNSCERCHTGRK
jgi:hypothetical protein